MSRQRLGQHFLRDTHWQKRIFEALPKNPDGAWLEIGPGHGEMTHHLAATSRRVVVVEADEVLAATLRERTQTNPREWGHVEVISRDILQVPLADVIGEKFRVYGSLPYYITSPILNHLFAIADQVASIHIVIQLEVAERIVAQPGVRDYGYLSTVSQFYSRPEIIFRIPPGAFSPPPRVHSALVGMAMPGARASLSIKDDQRFFEFVGICFSQKRKMLRNNLRSIATESAIQHALATSGLRPDARAEQLTLSHFAALFAEIGGQALPAK